MMIKYSWAESRKTRFWHNVEEDWEQFKKRILETKRTEETFSAYQEADKETRGNYKDRGGFVGGHLQDGMRGKGKMICRSLVVLDLDEGGADVFDVIAQSPYLCCWHTTHSHSPEKPRIRLVLPLERGVSEEEYEPVARKIAEAYGLNRCDDSTFQANRMMYWPTTSSDGEFRSGTVDAPVADPDALLFSYGDDWRDPMKWPRSERDKAVPRIRQTTAVDPCEKRGIVGLFCRTYGIHEAIQKFLSEVYIPSVNAPNRYSYAEGETADGLVVYDNKWAYSFHSSDPARGSHNAFDLVRIHLFGKLDEEIADDVPMQERTSFKKMVALTGQDSLVRERQYREEVRQLNDNFVYLSDISRGKSKNPKSWMKQLSLGRKGEILDKIENCTLILKNDSELRLRTH